MLPRVRNYNVAVAEDGERVVFLHKIVPGGADRSYGIHVARLAGLPGRSCGGPKTSCKTWRRAAPKRPGAKPCSSRRWRSRMQMSFSAGPDPLREELSGLRPEEMSPLEALGVLYELHKKAKENYS